VNGGYVHDVNLYDICLLVPFLNKTISKKISQQPTEAVSVSFKTMPIICELSMAMNISFWHLFMKPKLFLGLDL